MSFTYGPPKKHTLKVAEQPHNSFPRCLLSRKPTAIRFKSYKREFLLPPELPISEILSNYGQKDSLTMSFKWKLFQPIYTPKQAIKSHQILQPSHH